MMRKRKQERTKEKRGKRTNAIINDKKKEIRKKRTKERKAKRKKGVE